jgi:dTDP-4-dehydrorhamnose 3,5-epimerase
MTIEETSLPGVLLLKPRIFHDERGAFWETWNQRTAAAAGLPDTWAQDNCSLSRKNVVRGIHYQVTQPQGKLVRVSHGAVMDVAVDLRRSSRYFGKHVAVKLTGDDAEMLWIPPGFGHGFIALTDNVSLAYKVTDYYSPSGERTILWNDSDLAIPWPIQPEEALVSSKDAKGSAFRDAEVFP